MGAYDACLAAYDGPLDDAEAAHIHVVTCCHKAGGDWNSQTNDCAAPPVNEADYSEPTGPQSPPKPTVVNPKPPTRQR